jgi:hypothetical protein
MATCRRSAAYIKVADTGHEKFAEPSSESELAEDAAPERPQQHSQQ